MKVDWLIIGGGIHGVHIAARLIGEARLSPEQLQILDPGERLLGRWRDRSQVVGMSHLRSPSVHHLGLSPLDLHAFTEKHWRGVRGLFAPPYDRPALSLFDAHSDAVIDSMKLDRLHLRGEAASCSVQSDGVLVSLADGREILAQQVVLAIGTHDPPERPEWAPVGTDRVHHVFQPGFSEWPSEEEAVAVVGGGISAAQVALRLAEEGHSVHLISRHSLREHQFDSDPGWLGPKFMKSFSREASYAKRRAMIIEARHRGSVPPDVLSALRKAVQRGAVKWHERDVDEFQVFDRELEFRLSDGETLRVNRVLLASGFGVERPGGVLIDQLIESAQLACAECGYPIVDAALRWHSRVFVSGALAELELGPSSRNIAGARRAAERIIWALRGERADELPTEIVKPALLTES